MLKDRGAGTTLPQAATNRSLPAAESGMVPGLVALAQLLGRSAAREAITAAISPGSNITSILVTDHDAG